MCHTAARKHSAPEATAWHQESRSRIRRPHPSGDAKISMLSTALVTSGVRCRKVAITPEAD